MAGNQYKADPRQALFLKEYLDPNSPTFANCLQSGLKAGYSQEYSESLTAQMPDWLSERLGDNKFVHLAEKALVEALEYSTLDENGKVDSGAGRIKMDAVKLVLKGLAKERFSERTEHAGIGGKDLPGVLVKIIDERQDKDN